MVDQKKLSRREAFSNVDKVVYPVGLLASTALNYERPLQVWIKAGREGVELPQDELAKDPKKDGIGDLSMLSTKFGTGRMVDGRHPVGALPRTRLTSQALHYRINAVEKAHRRVTTISQHLTPTTSS